MVTQVMVFEPTDPSSAWSEALAGALNWVVDSINGFFVTLGLEPPIVGEFYVKDGAGYLPLSTVVNLKTASGVGALLTGIASILWTITKIGFVVKVVDVVSDPLGSGLGGGSNIGWYVLLGVGVVAFAYSKGR